MSKPIRVFFAIDFPTDIQMRLAKLIAQMKTNVPAHLVRFTPVENLHLTLKFLGEVEEPKLKSIFPLIHGLTKATSPFSFQLGGQGFFPNAAHPSILWIGCANYTHLAALAMKLDKITQEIGIPPENRIFKPHLTVGRVNQSARMADYPVISSCFAKLKIGVIGEVQVCQITLYKSELTPDGAKYSVVERFSLAPQEVNAD